MSVTDRETTDIRTGDSSLKTGRFTTKFEGDKVTALKVICNGFSQN